MTMIDNAAGVSVCLGVDSFNEKQMTLEKSFIVGEWPASQDCPPGGGFCKKESKTGIYSFSAVGAPSEVHPTKPPAKPYYGTMNDGSWNGNAYIRENIIKNYPSITSYGNNMAFFKMGKKLSPDVVSPHYFWGNTLTNVEAGGLVSFMDPSPGWANPTDCVDFPCSGPNNILTSWEETRYGGDDDDDGGSANPNEVNYGGRF